MAGELLKRLVNVAVLSMAALTFFLIPVGRKTLAQHVVAIFGTEPAREAADACADAGRRVVDRATGEHRGSAVSPPLPSPPPSRKPPPPPADLPPAD